MSQYVPPNPQFPQGSGVAPKKKMTTTAIVLIVIGIVGILFVIPCIGILVAIAVPSFLRAREISRRNACQENLSKIDGAKTQWGLEKQPADGTAPAWSDLVGPSVYLRRSPVCPSGGTYSTGTYAAMAVEQQPSCSLSAQGPFPHEFPGGGI